MPLRAENEYRYEKLTWPEINDAVEMGKVCIVPCGAVEQHGLDALGGQFAPRLGALTGTAEVPSPSGKGAGQAPGRVSQSEAEQPAGGQVLGHEALVPKSCGKGQTTLEDRRCKE